jgi:hypothetical protein
MQDSSGNEMNLCYSLALNTSSVCQASNGQWDFQRLICTFPAYTTSQLCTTNIASGQFFTCNSALDQNSCNALQTGSGGNFNPANDLQCQWNSWAACRSASECTSTGRCNDFDLSVWNGQSQSLGVCVQLWQYDQNGNRQQCQQQSSISGASTGIMQTKLGCANQTVTNESSCAALSGYQWIARANSSTACGNHGAACFMNAFDTYDYNLMTSTMCSDCRGNYESIYQYTFGLTEASTILPLSWVARQWAQVNQWKLTISQSKMNNAVQQAVTSIIARQQLNDLSTQYNRLIPLMEIVACDCLSSQQAGTDCFQNVAATVVDVDCRKDPALVNSCGPLVWNDTTVFANQNVSSSNVQVVRTMAGPFLLQFATRNTSGRRRLLALADLSYAIIKNNNSVIVGQIIGDGFYFNNVTGSNANICLTRSLMIGIVNSDFQIYDLVVSVNNQTVSQWLNISLTSTGLQLCTSIAKSGIYFPIARVKNPETYVLSYSASSPSAVLLMKAISGLIIIAIAFLF